MQPTPTAIACCRAGGAYPYSFAGAEARTAAMTDTDAPSIDPAEVAKFTAEAEAWWDPAGQFAPLHRLNPTRIAFVRDRLAAARGRDPLRARPLAGIRLLDIGCGGGLLAEPMTRLGARVTGIDASAASVAAAARHARQSGLAIQYRHAAAEELAAAGERFDAVLNMEVVEHAADRDAFLAASAALLGPGGTMFIATLNRTAKAFLFAILGAEYVLRWLPRGTHDWRKFVRPSELAAALRPHSVEIAELAGVTYGPITDTWRLSNDLDVNYMAVARRL